MTHKVLIKILFFCMALISFLLLSHNKADASGYCQLKDSPICVHQYTFDSSECNYHANSGGDGRSTNSSGMYWACYHSMDTNLNNLNSCTSDASVKPGYNNCAGSSSLCGVYKKADGSCKVSYIPDNPIGSQYVCSIDNSRGYTWIDRSESYCTLNSSSSCFPAGTQVTMADKSTKKIEDVKIGDKVLGYNGKSQVSETVKALENPVRDHMYTLSFSDNTSLSLTREHPLYTPAGWKSISPEDTSKENASLKVQQLKIGDSVLNDKGKYIKIISMKYKEGAVQTYNLKSVTGSNDFYADGKLAHNKGTTTNPPPGCSCTAWTYHVCGGGGCPANQKNETRSCDGNCDVESKCSGPVDVCQNTCNDGKSVCGSYNRCHKWTVNGCTYDCGKCNKQGYSCDPNPKSGTDAGGNCKYTGPSCSNNCKDIGAVSPGQANGRLGQKCKKQDDECGTGNTILCGNCGPGLHCGGQTPGGKGGVCVSDGPPPQYNVTVLAFYDADASGNNTSYNQCYPSTDGKNGNASGNVNITINSGETGVATKTYSKVSYKNCKTGGTGGSLGFTIQRTDKTKAIKFNNPNPNLYELTGYNFSINNGPTTVCKQGATKGLCNGSWNKTPMLTGQNVIVRFGYRKKTANPPAKQLNAMVFEDLNQNGIYDNGESCFNSGTTDPLTINGTDFYESSLDSTRSVDACKFFHIDNNTNHTVTLSQIGAAGQTLDNYVATGFEYVDANNDEADKTNGCYGNDAMGIDEDGTVSWGCIHDSSNTASTESINLSGDSEVHFGVFSPPDTYSVSGSIFVDEPPLGTKDPGEDGYKGGQPKTIYAYYAADTDAHAKGDLGGQDVANSNGVYQIAGLEKGAEYTISYDNFPPSGYEKTYPRNGTTPPSFDVKVGPSVCWIETPGQKKLKDATCSNGNIINLNFGVTATNDPWFQVVGGDVRVDGDLTDKVPTGRFLAIGNAANPVMDPGIVFTDQPSADLGGGVNAATKANSPGWISRTNLYNSTGGTTKASYDFVKSSLDAGGQSPLGLYTSTGPCNGQSAPFCVFPSGAANFPADTWIANQNLEIPAGADYTFPPNNNYIILVNGDLTIRRNLIVPTTSTVIFIVKGNILIGGAPTEIDGIYAAGGRFTVAAATTQLVVEGSIIANTDLGTKINTIEDVFNNARDLGATNATVPAVKIIARPDFMIHLPTTIRVNNYVIQEVAPGPGYQFGQ